MVPSLRANAISALAASTAAFTVCFAVWMLYGVLVTFLVDERYFQFSRSEIGWLIGAPVLTGAIFRLPVGVLADKYGGRAVLVALMLITAIPLYLVSHAGTYWGFLLAGLGLGLAGSSFAAGISYVSPWFPAERQGMVLGIFGMGTAGAALTNLVAPGLLDLLVRGGADREAWRMLPKLYAAALVATAILFWLFTHSNDGTANRTTLGERLAPLRRLRVWRFGLYYAFTFGSFVALSQWLVPYYVNVYSTSVAWAGGLAAAFSLPSGIVRALGGWVSDRVGPRTVLYCSFGAALVLLVLLFPPRVELQAPGQGVVADRAGTVTSVSDREVVVGNDRYHVHEEEESEARVRFGIHQQDGEGFLLLPRVSFDRVPVVGPGTQVVKGQLLIRGVTHVYFQSNKWIFTALVFLLGLTMGLGSGAVFKHIPSYFPGCVGAVGGIVGMLGALGGFVCPILFGYLLSVTGIWTTCWMLLASVGLTCLVWMHVAVRRLMRDPRAQPARQSVLT
jgi:NNP family nitrate/nitrite transporter-like MFS transporter